MEKEAASALFASTSRLRVFEAIRDEPGITVSKIAREVGLYWSTVALHVERLTRAGLVRSTRVGRRRVLFSSTEANGESAVQRGLLAEDACRRVAVAVVEHPRTPIFELSHRTGISERALYHHVKRLVEAELLSTSKERFYRGLEPTPRLLALLERGARGPRE